MTLQRGCTLYNKYHAQKTPSRDGIIHDSKKEARRWDYLNMLQKAGKISDLQRQVPYELIPAQYECFERYSKAGRRLKDGRRCVERPVTYIADFQYINEQGETIVEDAKGVYTNEYVIKRKLMRYIKGITIVEV